MKSVAAIAACLSLFSTVGVADSNISAPLSSHQILPDTFKPPAVFKIVNLLRNINLEKSFVRETVNVLIENTDSKAQDEYYIPFKAESTGHVGGLEVRDKNEPDRAAFRSEMVEFDPYSPTQFYRVTFPTPLAPSERLTLSINYHVISALTPLPAKILQQDQQYLLYSFSLYSPSVYPTQKQKTKLKLPTTDVPDFTSSPNRQGTTFTYGPYEDIPAGVEEEASVRYEFTKPVTHVTLLERDVEISQWGGNLATEERYWLTNKGAHLSSHFSRVTWTTTSYYNPPSSALKELRLPLKVGSVDAYFTDDIGNVSTSHFRTNLREASLELKPRYPVFGGWNYNFRVGWNSNLKTFLRKSKQGDGHVLKVPFLEGPKMSEGVSYEKVQLRVILPEGAINVKYACPIPIVASELSSHKTFMDTLGRTTLKLTAMNVVDESREKEVIVTYDYPLTAAFRKPVTIFAGVLAVFVTAWAVGRLDVSIGKRQ